VQTIERCSGHDGTYAVKKEFHEASMKIVKPVARAVRDAKPDHYTSDCVMAGNHIHNGLGPDAPAPVPPMTLLRRAYGV
jgi:Fe-S oxidoreductase